MTFPQTEDEAILKYKTFKLIYAQFGYLYTISPHVPQPTTKPTPSTSHAADGIIWSIKKNVVIPFLGHTHQIHNHSHISYIKNNTVAQ